MRHTAEGVCLTVRLTPKAAIDKIEGWKKDADGGAYLKARVRALPDKGKANKALLGLIAKTLGVAKSDVSIIAGNRSRIKQVLIKDGSRELIKAIKGC